MRPVLRLLAPALCGLVAIASTAIEQRSASVERGGRERYAAVAFDYLVLFNPDSVVSVVDQIAPGKGREFINLWRTRQFEYCWLRSITDRNQPLEELGLHPDRTVTDLNGLLDFVLRQER